MNLINIGVFQQAVKVFATQLLHRNRKMKDLFPPSSFHRQCMVCLALSPLFREFASGIEVA
jgi:hypothetical protein